MLKFILKVFTRCIYYPLNLLLIMALEYEFPTDQASSRIYEIQGSFNDIMVRKNYDLIAKLDEDGFILIEIPELGIVTQTKNKEDIESMGIDAIETYLEKENSFGKEFSITLIDKTCV